VKLNFLSCAADQDDFSLVSTCWLSGRSTFLALDSKGELHVFSEQLLSWTAHCGIHTTFIILQFSTCRIQCSIPTFQFTVSSGYIVSKRFEVQKKLFCREESNKYNTRNGMLLCICAVNQSSLGIHSEHTLQSFPVDRSHSNKYTIVRPQYTIVYYSPPQYTKTHHSILQ